MAKRKKRGVCVIRARYTGDREVYSGKSMFRCESHGHRRPYGPMLIVTPPGGVDAARARIGIYPDAGSSGHPESIGRWRTIDPSSPFSLP